MLAGSYAWADVWVSGKHPAVRRAAVANAFYPGSPDKLEQTVNRMLKAAPAVPVRGRIVAAVAPHAGYVYSGNVAACTYGPLKDVEFDTVVIIGHDCYRGAVAFTCPVDEFETPLGKVRVDREMQDAMQAFHEGIIPDLGLHAREHTIEVQLPFLQVTRKSFAIVPILFGNPTVENCRILSDAIRSSAGNRKVFVLASTDMSHYPSYTAARRADKSTLRVMEAMDAEGLFAHLRRLERSGSVRNLQTAMCASGGVGTAVIFARAEGATQAQVVRYANSGDAPRGDKGRVVGYCSALLVKPAQDKPRTTE
jgi:AmmeMemoRadiSam system protein B